MAKKIGRKIGISVIIAAFIFLPITYGTYVEGSPQETARVSVSSPQRSVDSNAAYAALQENLQSIGANDLISEYGITGVGQVIGIVDTGVDALMPGMFRKDGTCKIKIWHDLTNEGLGVILGKYKASQGQIDVQGVRLNVRNLNSASGTYVVGVLPSVISDLVPGKPEIYFIAYDPNAKGVFEAVVIDTDRNMDFNGEAVLYQYDRYKNVAKIEIDSARAVSLVLSSIDKGGNGVSFGFDLNGHGTSLASVISGYDRGYGGVAPGAEIIVAKAIGSTGAGDWYDIIRGIEYCINKGASIVLIGAVPDIPNEDPQWSSIQELAALNNVHLVIPSGNAGPGAGSLTFSGSSDSLIVASGYYPAATYRAIFGRKISYDTWYPFSSCGPDLKGNKGVDISAPALAPAPEPGYYLAPKFVLVEGTSVSAAYSAGALALLRQAAVRYGVQPYSGATLSMLEGAQILTHALPVEQGYGKIDLVKSRSLLSRGIEDFKLKVARKWNGEIADRDIWIKGTSLGAFPLWVDNFAPSHRQVQLFTTEPWLKCQTAYVNVSPIAQRDTVVYGLSQLSPGFYSGEILADDPSTLGVDGRLLVNVSIPERLSIDGDSSFNLSIDSSASVVRRFISVPESVQRISLSLAGEGSGARFVLYSPDGILVQEGFVEGSKHLHLGLPSPGLWQLCLFRDVQDEILGRFSVTANIAFEGVCVADLGVTGDIQQFSVKSDDRLPVEFTFLAESRTSEWRHRQSTLVYAGKEHVISIPGIDESVNAITVRCGTTDESVLRACLYRIDKKSGRWIEVQRTLTDENGTGQVTVTKPEPGEYYVTLEAYTQALWAYAEIDCIVIKEGGTSKELPFLRSVNYLNSGTNTIQMRPGKGYHSAKTVAIRHKDDGRVLGVINRTCIEDPSQIPVIQVMGKGDLRTIKAYHKELMIPIDAAVTIDNATYQLHRGKITGPINVADYGEYHLPEGAGLFHFEL